MLDLFDDGYRRAHSILEPSEDQITRAQEAENLIAMNYISQNGGMYAAWAADKRRRMATSLREERGIPVPPDFILNLPDSRVVFRVAVREKLRGSVLLSSTGRDASTHHR